MEEPKEKDKDSSTTTSTNAEKQGFFKFVFNFDEESKANIFNLLQFASLAFLPIVGLNKLMQKYVPESDDQKSSIEILIEILVQIFVMFLGIFFIHRIIIFIPTISEVKYPEFNVIITIIPILLITLSLQTKLGEKVSVLTDRISDSWEGKTNGKKKKTAGKSITVTQPLENFTSSPGTTSISALPQTSPNFDSFYAQQPQQQKQHEEDQFQVLAANEVLGGSFGSGF